MTEQKIHHPHLAFRVSYHKKNNNPEQRNLRSFAYPALFYIGDNIKYQSNIIDHIAQEFGIQVDVQNDVHIPDLTKKGATIYIKDTTPDKKFPSHNISFRMEPNQYKAFKFDMGDNIFICLKCGLYLIHEEHLLQSNETIDQYFDRSQKEFIPIFFSMKPVIDEYEKMKKFSSRYKIIQFEDSHFKEINFYKKYYMHVGARGLSTKFEGENFNEML